MTNKRIHELLEWVKEVNKPILMPKLGDGSEVTMHACPTYEILQHLLERDIERSQKQEDWENLCKAREKEASATIEAFRRSNVDHKPSSFLDMFSDEDKDSKKDNK